MPVQEVKVSDKGWMTSLPGAALLIALYGLVHTTLRLGASPNLGENDPQVALSIQDGLRWTNPSGEPPLFEWLAYFLAELFGPTALIFQILRYGLLALTLVFVFLTARRLTGSGFWALVSVEGYALVYQISWRMHEGFTHPMVAIAAAAGLFYALLRLRDRVNVPNAALFMVMLVAGLLSDTWFYGFLAAFLLALLIERSTRPLLVQPLVLTAIVAAALIAAPYWRVDTAFWAAPGWQLFTTPQMLISVSLSDRLNGLLAGLTKPLLFASPLLPILVLWFWPSLRSAGRNLFSPKLVEGRPPHSTEAGLRTLWLIQALAMAGLVLLGFATGFSRYSEHAVMPLFFLAPMGLMVVVQRSAPSAIRVRRFLLLCLVLLVVAFGGRAANLVILDPICNRCYFGIPFAGLAEHFANDHDIEIVIADRRRLGGNLRVFLTEDQRVMALDWPSRREPVVGQGAVLIVQRQDAIESRVEAAGLSLGFEQNGPAELVTVPWTHAWRSDGYRMSTWYAVPGSIGQTSNRPNQ